MINLLRASGAQKWIDPLVNHDVWAKEIIWETGPILPPDPACCPDIDHNPPVNNLIHGLLVWAYLHTGSKSATAFEQYVERVTNFNLCLKRIKINQNRPPHLNNIMNGLLPSIYLYMEWTSAIPSEQYDPCIIISSLSSCGIKTRHPLWTIWPMGCQDWLIFIRDQNPPPHWTVCQWAIDITLSS